MKKILIIFLKLLFVVSIILFSVFFDSYLIDDCALKIFLITSILSIIGISIELLKD